MALLVADVGDVVRLAVTFYNAAGAATDPSAVTLAIKAPTAAGGPYATSTVAPTSDGSGAYHYDYQPPYPGDYTYRYAGTGIVTTAEEGYFAVRQSTV